MTVFDNTGSIAKLLPIECSVRQVRKLNPKAKARADAEWEASDAFGRLPEGWTWKGESK